MARPEQVIHGWMHGKLFLLNKEVRGEKYLGYWEHGTPSMSPVPMNRGTTVKVVMVSRFGDCGITPYLEVENGYVARVLPTDLICARHNARIIEDDNGFRCPVCKERACKNQNCCVSTGIHEGLTFGSGKLDDHGYWEFPCEACARAWEKEHPEDVPCWPFKQDSES